MSLDLIEVIPKSVRRVLVLIPFLFVGTTILLSVIRDISSEKSDPCGHYLSLYYKEQTGTVMEVYAEPTATYKWIVTFVENDSLHERYGFDSDRLVRHAEYGDSVYKPRSSNYGWLFKKNGAKLWLEFETPQTDCDTISQERAQRILRDLPEYYKR